MFSWLRAKSPEEREAVKLQKMLDEFREETKYINDKWNPVVRQSYIDFVATAWREFLAGFGTQCRAQGVGELSVLSDESRFDLGDRLAETMHTAKADCDRLRSKVPTPEYHAATARRFAYKHVGLFVTSLIMGDTARAKLYTHQLDAYLADAGAEDGDLAMTFEKFAATQSA